MLLGNLVSVDTHMDLVGKTLMWEAQKDFHKCENDIRNFVTEHLTEEFCQLDSYVYQHLLDFQEAYVTSPDDVYPYQQVFGYNFFEYMNNIQDELIPTKNVYSISMLEDVKDDEYYNRLYFRRRQGWGKSVISQN